MKRILNLIACIIVFCSMSECRKENAVAQSNAIDFTLDCTGGETGLLFEAGQDDIRNARLETDEMHIDAVLNGGPEKSLYCNGLIINLKSDTPLAQGNIYESSGSGVSLNAIFNYSYGENEDPEPASSKSGSVKIIIMSTDYAAGTFSFCFDIYDKAMQKTECKVYDGFFSIYFK